MDSHRLVLHEHPFASYCQKALIALYELDLPFDTRLIVDDASRRELAALWPLEKMPVLRDETAGLVLPESTTIIEYLDSLAPGGPRLVPADPAAALQARLWDRFHDQYVMNPMQKIVGDELRPDGGRDPEGVVGGTTHARHRLRDPGRPARLHRRLDGRPLVHDRRLRRGARPLLRPRGAPLGRAGTGQRDALLPRPDAVAFGRPRDRRGPPLP